MTDMLATLRDICFDCTDHQLVARFWSTVLGYRLNVGDSLQDPVAIVPVGPGVRMWFMPVPESKSGKNRLHIDINLSDVHGIDRLQELGARVLGEISGDDGTLWWTVLADPEGNEFCAFLPRE